MLLGHKAQPTMKHTRASDKCPLSLLKPHLVWHCSESANPPLSKKGTNMNSTEWPNCAQAYDMVIFHFDHISGNT